MAKNKNRDELKTEIINQIADEVERLQKSAGATLVYRDYLEATYGTREYSNLTIAAMRGFHCYLKALTPDKISDFTDKSNLAP